MTLRDGSASIVDNPADVSPSEPYGKVYARQRAEEVTRRQAELTAGKPITAQDISLAHRRADEAHVRARRAHLALAAGHLRCIELHERATAAGIGDFFAHEYAAVAHRVATENAYNTADERVPDRNDSV
jgi:hypothetical protein